VSFPGLRLLGMLPLIALPTVGIADLGSVAVVRLSIPDDAHEAGRAAVQAIENVRMPTSLNAKLAYDAAAGVAALHRQVVDPATFTIYSDGAVKLTVRRTAPTVLFKHVPGLNHLPKVNATTIVERVRY
jgi:hypothetical protein